MKIISDIRLYKSNIENIDGNSLPDGFSYPQISADVNRVVMKLRENNFSLGDFDHLYINFTTCAVDSGIALSKRSVDKYHPWYRYYDVHIDDTMFSQLETENMSDEIINLLKKVLKKFGDEKLISSCISEALTQKEQMLMKFKEKQTAKRKAIIYLRYLDNCHYLPVLKVFDLDENLLFKTNLPEANCLDYLGNIQLSNKKVTIKPRKNSYAVNLEPICFDY